MAAMTTTIDSEGRVAIPEALRRAFGLVSGTEVVAEATTAGILVRAVRATRERYWAEVDAAVARIRAVPGEWEDLQAEYAAWDVTLLDGLDPDEVWTAQGEVLDDGPAQG